jgi:hypothetical protein
MEEFTQVALESHSALGDVVVLGSNNTVAQTAIGSYSVVGSSNYIACSILSSGTGLFHSWPPRKRPIVFVLFRSFPLVSAEAQVGQGNSLTSVMFGGRSLLGSDNLLSNSSFGG